MFYNVYRVSVHTPSVFKLYESYVSLYCKLCVFFNCLIITYNLTWFNGKLLNIILLLGCFILITYDKVV